MKAFFAIIFFLTSPLVFAQWGSVTKTVLSNQMILDSTLEYLSFSRCAQYLKDSTISKQVLNQNCSRIGKDFVKNLDSSIVTTDLGQSLPVVFRSDLIEIINDERLDVFLQLLEQKIDGVNFRKEKFSLYNLVRRFVRNSDEAVKWLGVLFQDNSPTLVHIQWLDQYLKNDVRKKERIEKLARLTLEMWRLKEPASETNHLVELLPPDLEKNLKKNSYRKMYHFYTIAYIGLKLKMQCYSAPFAAFAAYHFNFIYESTTSKASVNLLFNDPYQIPEVSAEDIFVGLHGSWFAFSKWPLFISEKKLTDSIKKNARSFNSLFAQYLVQMFWTANSLNSDKK